MNILAQGTGQALDTARRGEADVVFVHAKGAEQRFVAEGEGVKRFPVMYNDFVLIGPKSDPASIRNLKDVAKALKAIKDKQATFISRGDRSGTHLAELTIWKRTVGIDIEKNRGPWGYYRLAKVWMPHSKWRSRAMATCCPTAPRGAI